MEPTKRDVKIGLLVVVGIAAIWALAFCTRPAHAQGQVVNQGAPGTYGPWPVSISAGLSVDGGILTTPYACAAVANKSTTIGTGSASTTPSAQLTARKTLMLCVSTENTGQPLVKCRADGVDPIMGVGTPGEVLAVGDCVVYPVAAATTLRCISDTAATYVTSFECS